MPARSNRNGRKDQQQSNNQQQQWRGGAERVQQQHRSSPAPSPPTQLPTPLPEQQEVIEGLEAGPRATEEEALGEEAREEGMLAHLIDFDDEQVFPPAHFVPSPPPVHPQQPQHSALEDDDKPSPTTYRSPPFREAQLPPSSDDGVAREEAEPLPIPPRVAYLQEDDEEQEEYGHTRSPMLPRSPSSPGGNSIPNIPSLSSLSRTLRTYVPSSIHIPVPTAAPSPPLVSRPVSFGRFSAPVDGEDARARERRQDPSRYEQEYERDYEQQEPNYGYGYGHGQAQQQQQQQGYPQPSLQGFTSPRGGGAPPGREGRWRGELDEPSSTYGSGLAQAMRRGVGSPPPALGSPVARSNAPRAASMASYGPPASVSGYAPPSVSGYGPAASTMGKRGAKSGTSVVGSAVTGAGMEYAHGQGQQHGEEAIQWSRWDCLDGSRLLLLAYQSGLQIWDCTNLGSVSEILNLNFSLPEWELLLPSGVGSGVRVLHAAVLPSPSQKAMADGRGDPLAEERPLLGIIMESDTEGSDGAESESTFVLYSLRRHHLVKRLPMPGLAETFLSNEHFIVISTTTPPTLHILSSTTFYTLTSIPSASLAPFAVAPHSSNINNPHRKSLSISNANLNQSIPNYNSVSLGPHQGFGFSLDSHSSPPPSPGQREGYHSRLHPVFALNRRLLAYASASPVTSPVGGDRRPSFSSGSSGRSAPSLSSSPFGLALGKNITQADLGNAALKVGGSVLSGMRFLGGMAYEAAKNRVAPDTGAVGGAAVNEGGLAPLTNRFFSRSAPAAAGAGTSYVDPTPTERRERRYSNTSSVAPWDAAKPVEKEDHSTTVAPHTAPTLERGSFVTVVDLFSLLFGSEEPAVLAEFMSSKTQPVADLCFSGDGCEVLVVPRDGQVVRVYQLRPSPATLDAVRTSDSSPTETALEVTPNRQDTSWHLYNLRRGWTSGIVENVDWAGDGRWVAIGTRNRTVHVFATNPYGGQPDIKSHLEGVVRNVNELQPLGAEVQSLLRIRVKKPASHEARTPLSFTFISSTDTTLPSSLRPSAVSAAVDVAGSPPLSSRQRHIPTNFQDVLVFDPVDGVLSLRRFVLDQRPKEQGITASVSSALGATSISLPGMGGTGRLSSSPSTTGGNTKISSTKASRLSEMLTSTMELTASENIIATWNVQRQRDWGEIKRALEHSTEDHRTSNHVEQGAADWLAQAELSPCSRSTRLVPRPLYASHQFSFHTLGEDYHALIRRYQFDISGSKIDVRREVEISAHPGTGGESFVESFSAPRDIQRAASSFDEPLASALSGGFDYQNPQAVLPMYPNGIPGSKPKSFRNSIPIRTMAGIGDGVSEGFGRIKREIHKVRSPVLVPRSDNSIPGPVPLEFDEEDEDFLSRDGLDVPGGDGIARSRTMSRGGDSADSAPSISTPATDTHVLDNGLLQSVDDEMWDGWDREDKPVIEEAERFDDISAVGFLDEEHASMMQAAAKKRSRKRGR
ncbi:hypothetical protein BDQ12DRAFT_692387 [Crucibulum laeve]|uniref:BCAS3 WD40 domain-containing protein n=1 Tax=Crucibulum laeve TaxID=68775 RepID=A0A5C3LI34_9AGAR|nr:hypothetical protein BDQ12DRAFT_692387 [Crucibulum laeve]